MIYQWWPTFLFLFLSFSFSSFEKITDLGFSFMERCSRSYQATMLQVPISWSISGGQLVWFFYSSHDHRSMVFVYEIIFILQILSSMMLQLPMLWSINRGQIVSFLSSEFKTFESLTVHGGSLINYSIWIQMIGIMLSVLRK